MAKITLDLTNDEIVTVLSGIATLVSLPEVADRLPADPDVLGNRLTNDILVALPPEDAGKVFVQILTLAVGQ